MGFFDGITANLLRSDNDGKSYYAPLGRFGPVFEVPHDEEARRLRRSWQWFTVGGYIAGFAVGITFATSGEWPWLLLLIPIIVTWWTFALLVARGFPRAKIRHADLIPITRASAFEAYVLATGRRPFEVAAVTNFVLAAAFLLLTLGTGRGILWVPAALFAVFTILAFYAVSRIRD